MSGFFQGIPSKAVLSVAGTALASGGAVGLAHSTPTILRKTGTVCSSLDFGKEKSLERGHQYLEKNTGELVDVTSQIQQRADGDKDTCWA